MKAIERIIHYIESEGINKSELERKCGISNGYLGKQYAKNADVGESVLRAILENCPNLSQEWLFYGNGEMLRARIVDRMIEYIKAKNLNVDEIDKKIYGERELWVALGVKKAKPVFFKQFEDNPRIDVHPRGIQLFINKFAYDANPIWLLTGEGSMLKADEMRVVCDEKDKKIEELTKRIGVLEYQLEQSKSKKK
jgi:hypothetical protein